MDATDAGHSLLAGHSLVGRSAASAAELQHNEESVLTQEVRDEVADAAQQSTNEQRRAAVAMLAIVSFLFLLFRSRQYSGMN